MVFRRIPLFAVFVLVFGGRAVAEAPKRTIFLATPQNLSNYERDFDSLGERPRWHVRIHGIRYAGLDPRIWAIRKIDRTDNRRLVPIRPLYLRASEAEDFRIDRIELEFRFKPVKVRHMKSIAEQKTPILDIGFGGEFEPGHPGELPAVDRGYVLRLTAHPDFESGFMYHSQGRFLPLGEPPSAVIVPDTPYSLAVLFNEQSIEANMNGEVVAQLEGSFSKGLVHLVTGWHPIKVESLMVYGTKGGESVELSGLVVSKQRWH